MNEVVRILHARKRFGSVVALDDMSLSLREGECHALVGPNGAGKTTTIRALCGTLQLDAGSITWATGPADMSRRKVGLVPQEIALYPLLTGSENLEVFGGLHGLRDAVLRERVSWALDWCGLTGRAHDPVGQWSVGMKRRLNIACGLLHDPRVILLDEPTAGVDPESRQHIWELLLGLRANGTSLLVTTHQLNEAQAVSDRVAIINFGKVIACGTSEDIVREALGREHRVTARLADGARRVVAMRDVSAELPAFLRQIEGRGESVVELDVRAPDLEAAFLHLTRVREGADG